MQPNIGNYLEHLGPVFGMLFMSSVIALGILLVATFAVQLVRSWRMARGMGQSPILKTHHHHLVARYGQWGVTAP